MHPSHPAGRPAFSMDPEISFLTWKLPRQMFTICISVSCDITCIGLGNLPFADLHCNCFVRHNTTWYFFRTEPHRELNCPDLYRQSTPTGMGLRGLILHSSKKKLSFPRATERFQSRLRQLLNCHPASDFSHPAAVSDRVGKDRRCIRKNITRNTILSN